MTAETELSEAADKASVTGGQTVPSDADTIQGSTMDDGSRMSARSSEKPEGSVVDPADDAQSLSSGKQGTEADLNDEAITLKNELDKIIVETPTITPVEIEEVFDLNDFGESYKENTNKEKQVLLYAENFRRQYVHLYRQKKPLFLNPVNECAIEKFVCTTVRVTQLPYEELYDWDGAAEFVADYLNFVPLDPPFELPTRLLSSMTVLKRQLGNCFEYATLLCSLLLGSGYDAYVVSGYATRETCIMDETREICPLLQLKQKAEEQAKKAVQKKYAVRPPKDLRSKFEVQMAARKDKEELDEEEKRQVEQQLRQLESEKPPPDDLLGLRIHAWVLVLEGKREVPESFFIEPFTGLSHPIDTACYDGIESLWNDHNYWVNMQDCSFGVKKMRYDLGDCQLFEYMFPSNDKPLLQIPDEEDLLDFDEEDEDDDVEKDLDMPPSWIEPICVSLKDFQMRCPHGKKTKLYKRAKLEKFAHYLMKDGLTSRLSIYDDRELLELLNVKEYYAFREDKLHERHLNHTTGWTTEYYHPGRSRSLKEHQYRSVAPGPENDRTMIFYHEARVCGLERRTETSVSMVEHFIDRDDFLFYRSVEFAKRTKKFGPADSGPTARPILKMVEKYKRNRNKAANVDISELIFLVSEEKIQIVYHTEDDKVSASTREFIKPANADEKGSMLLMTPDMHTTFQVDPHSGATKQVERYEMMLEMINAEDRCRERVRESEHEVQEILHARIKEETASELEISVYDTTRNEKAKKHRAELERHEMEERLRRQEMELDYLAPFLAQIGDPEKVSWQQAHKLKEICLADLKQRLIDKANLIQARFEKETQELQKKQTWYQQNQVSMQKDDEEEYLNYCSDAMFRIHILELRLNRHKELAPKRYMELHKRIHSDSRLMEFLSG